MYGHTCAVSNENSIEAYTHCAEYVFFSPVSMHIALPTGHLTTDREKVRSEHSFLAASVTRSRKLTASDVENINRNEEAFSPITCLQDATVSGFVDGVTAVVHLHDWRLSRDTNECSL